MWLPKNIKEVWRSLRKSMTNSEKIIWSEIRDKKLWYRFLRQKPIYLYSEDSWLERYVIPDFCCIELKLILEIDWNIHDVEEVHLLDLEKEKLLTQKWFIILRVKNEEIYQDLNKVLLSIKQCLWK